MNYERFNIVLLARRIKNPLKSNVIILFHITVFSAIFLVAGQSFAQTAQVPDPPVGFTATAISPTSIFLGWSPPQNNGGAPITGYKVEYRMVPATTDSILVTLGNVTNYTHTNLVTGKTYIYRVSAINSAGTGNPTPEQLATPTSSSAPPKKIAPNPPQNLVASVYSATQINLSWGPPADNGGPVVTGYRIDYSTDSGNFTNLVANSGSSYTAYSHTGLQVGHTYTYRVFAINSIGTGNSSNTASATPVRVNTVPGAPALSANPSSSTSISLSWVPPSDDGGTPITGYRIEYENGTSSFLVLVSNTGSTQTGYMHTGLVKGTNYSYRVSAINSVGVGSPSNMVTTQPQDTTTAIITTAIAVSPTSAKITWIAPSQTYGQIISGYRIDQVINGNFLSVDSVSGSTASYTIPNLTTGKTYVFAVTALLSGGSQTNPSPTASVTPTSTSSAPSSPDQQQPAPTPQDQTLPDPPSNLNATMVSQNTVKLSWVAPSNNGKLPVTGYKIESKTGASGSWYTVTSNIGVQDSFVKSGLQPGTTYFYRVSSISDAGTGHTSGEIQVTTESGANQTATPPPPVFVPQQSQGFIPVTNTTATLSYKITGGQILNAGINSDTFSLNLNLKTSTAGTLTIQLPRDIIDAKGLDGTDETYIVTVDKGIAQFNETKTASYRTLDIAFPENAERVSIYGTSVVPEFPVAIITLLAAFIPVIWISRRAMTR